MHLHGFCAYAALFPPITYASPSSRQHIPGITPGLGFLRNPSRHAIRLAPTHKRESTCRVTPFPVAIVRILRAVLSTGFLGSAHRSVLPAAGALSLAFWPQRVSLLRWFLLTMAQPHLRLRYP